MTTTPRRVLDAFLELVGEGSPLYRDRYMHDVRIGSGVDPRRSDAVLSVYGSDLGRGGIAFLADVAGRHGLDLYVDPNRDEPWFVFEVPEVEVLS